MLCLRKSTAAVPGNNSEPIYDVPEDPVDSLPFVMTPSCAYDTASKNPVDSSPPKDPPPFVMSPSCAFNIVSKNPVDSHFIMTSSSAYNMD